MIPQKIESLNSSLDRLLQISNNARLNAPIPYPYTGRGIAWIDPMNPYHRDPRIMHNNTDIEEQFHWVYGPYVLDNYEEQINNMIRDISTSDGGHFMCSTVKIDTTRILNTLIVNIIFIRPCLQKKHLFGKIISGLAEHLPQQITLEISNCLPESQNAINKYYGGTDTTVFQTTTRSGEGGDTNDVTYKLINSVRLQEIYANLHVPPLPHAIELNGRDLSPIEIEWSELAENNTKLGLVSKFVEYQFKTGYADISLTAYNLEIDSILNELEDRMQDNAVVFDPRDEDTTPEEVEEANLQNMYIDNIIANIHNLHDDKNLPTAMLFTPKTIHDVDFETQKKLIRDNVFYRSIIIPHENNRKNIYQNF